MIRKDVIESSVRTFFKSSEEGSFTDKEMILILANILYFMGKENIRRSSISLNPDNAIDVEHHYLKDPDNFGLSALLQSHVFIKWAEGLP